MQPVPSRRKRRRVRSDPMVDRLGVSGNSPACSRRSRPRETERKRKDQSKEDRSGEEYRVHKVEPRDGRLVVYEKGRQDHTKDAARVRRKNGEVPKSVAGSLSTDQRSERRNGRLADVRTEREEITTIRRPQDCGMVEGKDHLR